MLRFQNVAAQGEIMIRRVERIPDGCSPFAMENGQFIIGHSETGHNHVLSSHEGATVMTLDRPPEGMKVLYAVLENPTSLDHLRGHDTHESIMLEPGTYEFRIAREFDPYAELARLSAD